MKWYRDEVNRKVYCGMRCYLEVVRQHNPVSAPVSKTDASERGMGVQISLSPPSSEEDQMSLKAQITALRQIENVTNQAPYLDNDGYISSIMGDIKKLTQHALNYAVRRQNDYSVGLPLLVEITGHIPVKVKHLQGDWLNQFDYAYSAKTGTVNVLQVDHAGVAIKTDKTEFCKQIDAALSWSYFSPMPCHYNAPEGCAKTDGGAA